MISAEFATGELLVDRSVAPGEAISLDLFASDMPSSTALADLGLSTVRLLVSPGEFQFTGTTADAAFVSSPELDNPNPTNDNTIDANGNLLVISQGLDDLDNLFGGFSIPVFPTDGRVRLGTLNLVVPDNATGSVSFGVEEGNEVGIPGFSGSVAFGGSVNLGDVTVVPFTGTLQVASVPEPSATFLLMSFALGSLSCRRCRLNG